MSTPAAFPPPRVAPNLRHAFGGVLRLSFSRAGSIGQWWPTIILTFALSGVAYLTIRHGNAVAFFDWMTKVYLTFLLPILAFISGAGAIRDEMKGNAVDYILVRPISRSAFALFRYVAQLAWAQLTYLPLLVGLLVCGLARGVPGVWSAAPLLLATQLMAITAFAALGFVFGSLTSRYLMVGLIYGAIVEVGLSRIPVQISQLSLLHHVQGMLSPLLSRLPFAEAASASWMSSAVILAAASIAMVVFAATVFSQRELVGARAAE